jgi:hypothetical protein
MQDLSSSGNSGRIPSPITGNRAVHLLSGPEQNAFYIYEACFVFGVVDIREQYPLWPPEETLQIAKDLNVEHPKSPATGDPIVMTTDLLVTRIVAGVEMDFARDMKPAIKLGNIRTQQKFEIARRYFKAHGIDWAIVTEEQIPTVLAQNLKFLREFWSLDRLQIQTETATVVAEIMLPMLFEGTLSLSDAANLCDKKLGLERSTSRTVAYHLIYTRKWVVDLTVPFRMNRPVTLLSPKNTKHAKVLIQFPPELEH